MVSLYSPLSKPFSSVAHIAIGIKESSASRHVGILYRENSVTELSFLHLPWHNALSKDVANISYFWLPCDGISDSRKRLLCRWLEQVWRSAGEKIPYGIFLSPTGHFDKTGRFLPSETGFGLTCATFVFAMFEGFGIRTLDTASWKHRADDLAFHTYILSKMLEAKPPIDANHIAEQVMHFGIAVRFRPEEVAAAISVYSGIPVRFEEAEPAGHEVLAKIRA
jgi:hypothetical protein